MAISQKRSRRKPTGARYKKITKKRHYETGNSPVLTKIGENKQKVRRVRGGAQKTLLLKTDVINVLDPKKKKAVKAKITNVVENEANRNYIRANILTKGSIVETDKGKAKITNRPGQEGTVNGVLVTEK